VSSSEVLDRLTGLHPKLIDLSLDRVLELLDRLGNPQNHLPPVVHVAGTNGKGSTIAYMRTALELAGYNVHVHISPHLVHFGERIRLAGNLIKEEPLIKLLEECEAANQDKPITFFEITTAAALLAFSRHPADIVLLETGLGGRLDATNVVKKPALSVITPISMDHQQFLGETLPEIAAEKAGIIKQGVPCVTALQPQQARDVFKQVAEERGSPLIEGGFDWQAHEEDGQLIYMSGVTLRKLPLPTMVGSHQIQNAGLATAALDLLPQFTLSDEVLGRGIQSTKWMARLQPLQHGPLVDKLPFGSELWLDGGHNAAAGVALAQQAKIWSADGKPLHLICGMLNTKDIAAFLSPVFQYAASISAITIPNEPNSFSAAEFSEKASGQGIVIKVCDNVATAVDQIVASSGANARIMICGSLYLAGQILADNG